MPITLGIRPSPGAKGAAAEGRPASKSQHDETLRRDDYTCRCCGFRSEKFQRVIPSEPSMKTSDAFVTVCPFCDSCFNLVAAGMTGAGLLIWAPELSQADLNNIVRAAYIARAEGGDMAPLADRALDALKMRRTEAKKRLGSDDPLLLATAFQENVTPQEYAARGDKIDGIRFFPLDRYLVRARVGEIDQFPQMLGYWRSPSGPYGALSPEGWQALFDAMTAASA